MGPSLLPFPRTRGVKVGDTFAEFLVEWGKAAAVSASQTSRTEKRLRQV